MSDKDGKPHPSRRSRSRVSITRFGWALVGVALIWGLVAIASGNDRSFFIWADVGLCLLAGVVFFLIGLKGCRSHPGRGVPTVQATVVWVAAVIAIFAPAVKGVVEVSGSGSDSGRQSILIEPCRPEPGAPPVTAPRS